MQKSDYNCIAFEFTWIDSHYYIRKNTPFIFLSNITIATGNYLYYIYWIPLLNINSIVIFLCYPSIV